ncbi:MAG: hypothetical protein Q9170_006424 [Blastenia crenularia]
MTERQGKASTTGSDAKAPSSTYVPVQRGFGSLSSRYGDMPDQQKEPLSPMQRWMSEQPGQSPYHNIGSVANGNENWVQTGKSQSQQHTETSSNQATAGSWGYQGQADPIGRKPKVC